jgi:hypothetical protein
LLIPVFLGFYQILREGGGILWVAVAASLMAITYPPYPVLGTSSLFFTIVYSAAFFLTLAWFLIMGVFLLRQREAA